MGSVALSIVRGESHSLTNRLRHSLNQSPTISLTCSLTLSLTYATTYSLTHPLTHPRFHSLNHSHSIRSPFSRHFRSLIICLIDVVRRVVTTSLILGRIVSVKVDRSRAGTGDTGITLARVLVCIVAMLAGVVVCSRCESMSAR